MTIRNFVTSKFFPLLWTSPFVPRVRVVLVRVLQLLVRDLCCHIIGAVLLDGLYLLSGVILLVHIYEAFTESVPGDIIVPSTDPVMHARSKHAPKARGWREWKGNPSAGSSCALLLECPYKTTSPEISKQQRNSSAGGSSSLGQFQVSMESCSATSSEARVLVPKESWGR